MTPPNHHELIRRVHDALFSLVTQDIHLLNVDVSERTIAANLVMHLRSLFPEWHVDAEYNRDGHEPKVICLPRHPIYNPNYEPTTQVSPDIIIHRRGTTHNLIVMEVKKSSNKKRKEFEFDKIKLHHYRNGTLHYEIALFIVINTDGKLGQPYMIEEIL